MQLLKKRYPKFRIVKFGDKLSEIEKICKEQILINKTK